MASLTVILVFLLSLIDHSEGSGSSTKEEIEKLRDGSKQRIELVDNDPEFLVGVRGIEKPLCFHMEGETDQVIRLLQDPESGIIVNARIFRAEMTNKTYLGTIMISRGNFQILAKQRHVMVNDVRFEWDQIRAFSTQGHRVVVGEDMAAVTFRRRRITLVIRRHFVSRENEIDYEEMDSDDSKRVNISDNEESDDDNEISNTDNEDNDNGNAVREGSNRADIMPVIGYEERESLINSVLSSKRRRSLLLERFFGINQDQAIVRNLIVEVDGNWRKKREAEDGVESIIVPSTEQTSTPNSNEASKKVVGESNKNGRQASNVKQGQRKGKQSSHHLRRLGRDNQERHKRQIDDDEGIVVTDYTDVDKKGDRTIFLGVYIADSRDFSNRTHGLLGQFLYKNVSLERIRYKNGRMKAVLLVNGDPNRRTLALLTLRRNMALNATRACWKIRNQGREVVDGRYEDYLVEGARNNSLKELPPPSPL